jgi:hypothetical protein
MDPGRARTLTKINETNGAVLLQRKTSVAARIISKLIISKLINHAQTEA